MRRRARDRHRAHARASPTPPTPGTHVRNGPHEGLDDKHHDVFERAAVVIAVAEPREALRRQRSARERQ